MLTAANTRVRVAMRTQALHPGEPCGDAAGHWPLPAQADGAAGHLLALVDGLGHGEPAAQAAQAGIALLDRNAGDELQTLLLRLETGLHETRGAAIGLARLDGGRLAYAGIGNTRAMRWRSGQLTRLSSQYGVVGHGPAQTVQVQQLDLQPDDWLLMFSDGLDEMLRLPPCLPEWKREPALLCEHLLQRWASGTDDAGVLVLHWEGG